jgi:cell fate (sporulation/competence/biofilm development) regulator YlbF (YheA/YmcA/DUF963 family)
MKEKKKKEAVEKLQEKERQVSITAKLFHNATHLWTKLEEDQKVQKWDKEEERINATIKDLSQMKKTMSITENVKGAQDMKKLQGEVTIAQT